MKTKHSKPEQHVPPHTQASLARALCVSRQTVAAQVKRGGSPPLNDLAAWTEHLAIHGRTGSLPDDLRRAIGKERLGILKETRSRLARDNALAAGRVIDAEAVAKFHGRLMGFLFSELDRTFASELPPALAGLDAVAVSVRARRGISALKGSLREMLAAWEVAGK